MEADSKPAGPPRSRAPGGPRAPRADRAPRPPRAVAATDAPRAEAPEGAPREDILPGDVHVATSTNIKTCAGAIAQKLRLFGETGVIAIGAVSVNQAVKSIILARKYVERDDYEISVSVELTPDVGPDAVQFRVSKTTAPYPDTPVPEPEQLKIGRQTLHTSLAGALAGRARGGAARLSVTGSGAGQVLLLVKALALASKFVSGDGLALNGYFDFIDIGEHTFVELQLFTDAAAPAGSAAAASPAV